MKDGIELFKEEHSSLESYSHSIDLFDRNVASYKFALANSLLKIAPILTIATEKERILMLHIRISRVYV